MPTRARRSTTRRSRSHATRRRAARPSVWDSMQDVHKRAKKRANKRSLRRSGHRSIHASLAEGNPADYYLSWPALTWRTFLALLLLVPSAISTLALFTITDHTQQSNFWADVFLSRPLLCFMAGAIMMMAWFWSKLLSKFFLYLYVLGHELTHAIFILLCGGKISGMSVSTDGGYVMTNKSNFLIALSPYFVPFWSFIVLGLSMLIEIFWNIPYHSYALYGAVGATWTFHLAWTLWMIPRDQPDLKENGTFFSVVVIYMANVLLLAAMLCLVPGGLSFKSYAMHWLSMAGHFYDACVTIAQRLM